jgi:hypothetical protein
LSDGRTRRVQITPIDIVNSVVGGLALIGSGVTAYFQFFRKVEDLHMSLLGVDYSPHAFKENTVTTELVFVNGGNVAATVTDLALLVPDPIKGSGRLAFHLTRFDNTDGPEPLAIPPGAIIHRCAVFSYPSSFFEDEPGDTQGDYRPTTLRAWVIGRKGVRYRADLEGIGLQWRHGMISGVESPQQTKVRLLPRPRGERPAAGPNQPSRFVDSDPKTIRVSVGG